MQLNNNDIMFLQAVQRVYDNKRSSGNKEPVSLRISRGSISEDIFNLFGVGSNSQGFWCFGVYVSFDPFVRETPAEDWQDFDKVISKE